MILTLEKKILNITLFTILFFLCSCLFPQTTFGQGSLTLSVSPTLYDMSAHKGQEWQSTIKVINVNNYDLTVYLDVVNFVPRGESGEVNFVPIDETDATNQTLAEWINITREPITIPREQTKEIPFQIKVPFDASPGGHYAAILVGTKPLRNEKEETKIQISQIVTSLIFTKVAGQISESASIREFRTTKNFLDKPEATLELRFENKGNVYLQPQGEIKIQNMWGEERGVIPINQNSHYGKVPHKANGSDGIRKFTFAWKGEWSMADIGRYTAIATLGYGTEQRQFVTAKTHFWVIPFKLLLGIIITLALFITLMTWLVRLYVRKMLLLSGLDIEQYREIQKNNQKLSSTKLRHSTVKIHAPVKAGILDLKQRLNTSKNISDYGLACWNFVQKNWPFFIGIFVVVLVIVLIIWYVKNATTEHRAYEVTYVNSDTNNVKLTSEEIAYNKMKTGQGIVNTLKVDSDLPILSIVNRSGVEGLGAEVRLRFEKEGYQISELEADFSSKQSKSVVIYNLNNQEEALIISKKLNNALLSVHQEEDLEQNHIKIIIGSDMINN